MKKISFARLFLAGFIATFVMTIFMYPAFRVRIPSLDFAGMLGSLLGGEPVAQQGTMWWLGMAEHFLNGSVLFPLLYTQVFPYLRGAPIVRGVLFAGLLWMLSLTVAMPIMGLGVLALRAPSPALIWLATGIFHVVYGLLLGAISAPREGAHQEIGLSQRSAA